MENKIKLLKYQKELLKLLEKIHYDHKPMLHINWILKNVFNEPKKINKQI